MYTSKASKASGLALKYVTKYAPVLELHLLSENGNMFCQLDVLCIPCLSKELLKFLVFEPSRKKMEGPVVGVIELRHPNCNQERVVVRMS